MSRAGAVNPMWLWSERFWLPNNLSWEELESTESKTYGQGKDLYVVVPFTALVMLCRLFMERVLAMHIGKLLNVSAVSYRRPASNAKLEKAYLLLPRHPTNVDILKIRKKTEISQRKLERWIRQRKKSERPSDLKKFCETFWRFTFYLSSSVLGICIVYGESYLSDSALFFTNHPQDHQLEQPYYIYYMIEMSFYCSLLLSQFSDIRRKDFIEMFIHHIATVMLISGSYITNFTKIGAVIMLVHDVSDVFLEFAKMAKYAKREKITAISFVLLSVAFISTRLVVLPFFVINSILYEGMVIMKPFCGFLKVLLCSLLLLQILHLYWFSHLLKAAYGFLLGRNQNDTRSETESSAIEENGVSSDNKDGKIAKSM